MNKKELKMMGEDRMKDFFRCFDRELRDILVENDFFYFMIADNCGKKSERYPSKRFWLFDRCEDLEEIARDWDKTKKKI